MNPDISAKAFSGFISSPTDLDEYTSSIAKTKRSFVSCQPQLTPLEPHFCLSPVLRAALLFPFAFSDRWGPFGVATGEALPVPSGASET